MRFSTRGDGGETSLLDGSRIPKFHLRPETYGTLDEASATLGVVRAEAKSERLKEIIHRLQLDLIVIGGELACPAGKEQLLARRITDEDVKRLTELIEALEPQVTWKKEFVIPGENIVSAQLHVARTIVRRAERLLANLVLQEKTLNRHLLAYLNRLADLLFVLALWAEKNA
ncbi:MAG TPA: cob(I)yrinic acid a,c-diamide adenosyltransferase [Syntrophales bacterium]|nr:cob(I)yrinic acid a,c-diamide adenosyltransferase [Syntrophales bacterium]